jgi:tetratricopeptide (TPR) repeat protein
MQGSVEHRRELATLFRIAREAGRPGNLENDTIRYAAARRITALLVSDGLNSRAASYLLSLADPAEGDPKDRNPADSFAAWYLFSAGAAFESAGEIQLALPLYERMIRTAPDLEIEGKSLHREALARLVANTDEPSRRIEFYRDLIARFPEAPDIGAYHFLLAKEYEKVGEWKDAMEHYTAFLPYFGAVVPGYPDALEYATRLAEFNASPKDWTFESLPDLIKAVRQALASGSARQLRKYMAKAGFFAVSWYQDSGQEANSKVAFDLSQFIQGRPIQSSETLHPSSGTYDAYLRTWGWTGRVPVWYLYFRKINFPADPEVHGHWEWAGIYFGEKMQ